MCTPRSSSGQPSQAGHPGRDLPYDTGDGWRFKSPFWSFLKPVGMAIVNGRQNRAAGTAPATPLASGTRAASPRPATASSPIASTGKA